MDEIKFQHHPIIILGLRLWFMDCSYDLSCNSAKFRPLLLKLRDNTNMACFCHNALFIDSFFSEMQGLLFSNTLFFNNRFYIIMQTNWFLCTCSMKMAVQEVHVHYYTTTWHIKEAKEQTNKSFITIVCMVIYHFTIFQNCDKSKECWVWLRGRVSDYTFLYEAQNNLTSFFHGVWWCI